MKMFRLSLNVGLQHPWFIKQDNRILLYGFFKCHVFNWKHKSWAMFSSFLCYNAYTTVIHQMMYKTNVHADYICYVYNKINYPEMGDP